MPMPPPLQQLANAAHPISHHQQHCNLYLRCTAALRNAGDMGSLFNLPNLNEGITKSC
jgi:hypothetical protein